jgi:hypothetical protein
MIEDGLYAIKPLFDLKVLKNDRFLSQDHEIIKRFYMVNTFILKNRVKPILYTVRGFFNLYPVPGTLAGEGAPPVQVPES